MFKIKAFLRLFGAAALGAVGIAAMSLGKALVVAGGVALASAVVGIAVDTAGAISLMVLGLALIFAVKMAD